MVVEFELDGKKFQALNGGPQFTFDEAVSFVIDCGDQEEVDYYWSKLTDGGRESMCGWLEDQFGLSWQVTPKKLIELIGSSDRARASRVMDAMLKMKKIEIADLEAAARG
jgi:predicted 3-demethylubiquinone-9 3-methyltransferase (glyoxalase superfamily)